MTALPGVHRYLDAAGRAGLTRAVVSASSSTLSMLELAGLGPLVEVYMDADVIRSENIRTPPSPDVLLTACRRLDVCPAGRRHVHAQRGRRPRGPRGRADCHRCWPRIRRRVAARFGAQRVVPSLSVLLGSSLTGGDAMQWGGGVPPPHADAC